MSASPSNWRRRRSSDVIALAPKPAWRSTPLQYAKETCSYRWLAINLNGNARPRALAVAGAARHLRVRVFGEPSGPAARRIFRARCRDAWTRVAAARARGRTERAEQQMILLKRIASMARSAPRVCSRCSLVQLGNQGARVRCASQRRDCGFFRPDDTRQRGLRVRSRSVYVECWETRAKFRQKRQALRLFVGRGGAHARTRFCARRHSPRDRRALRAAMGPSGQGSAAIADETPKTADYARSRLGEGRLGSRIKLLRRPEPETVVAEGLFALPQTEVAKVRHAAPGRTAGYRGRRPDAGPFSILPATGSASAAPRHAPGAPQNTRGRRRAPSFTQYDSSSRSITSLR